LQCAQNQEQELSTKNKDDESEDSKKEEEPTMQMLVLDRKPHKPNTSHHYNRVYYTNV